MTNHIAESTITISWAALLFIWCIGAFFTKPTQRAQDPGPYLFHLAVVILGFALLGNSWFRQGWLAARFLPNMQWLPITGACLASAGCLFAIWARIALGANWSGQPTVKAGHKLIVKGPYGLTRHPIYTGLLLAAVGTSIGAGELRCLVGLLLVILGFATKMGQEERLMLETFPGDYPLYRQRVKALIPGVL